MSQRRIVYIKVKFSIKDEGKIYLNLSEKLNGFLSKEEIDRDLKEILKKDGWKEDGANMVKEDGDVKIVYNIEKEEISVNINRVKVVKIREERAEKDKESLEQSERKRIVSEIKLYLEEAEKKFKEKYIPEMVKEAIKRKAKAIDPGAEIVSEKEDESSLSLTISLEV